MMIIFTKLRLCLF